MTDVRSIRSLIVASVVVAMFMAVGVGGAAAEIEVAATDTAALDDPVSDVTETVGKTVDDAAATVESTVEEVTNTATEVVGTAKEVVGTAEEVVNPSSNEPSGSEGSPTGSTAPQGSGTGASSDSSGSEAGASGGGEAVAEGGTPAPGEGSATREERAGPPGGTAIERLVRAESAAGASRPGTRDAGVPAALAHEFAASFGSTFVPTRYNPFDFGSLFGTGQGISDAVRGIRLQGGESVARAIALLLLALTLVALGRALVSREPQPA